MKKILQSRVFRGFLMVLFLALVYLILSGQVSSPSVSKAMSQPKEGWNEQEYTSTFGVDGELMNQLLSGMGSDLVAEQVIGLNLNCGSRILREEIVGNIAIMDVELECECIDSQGSVSGIKTLRGEWKMLVEK